MMKPYPTPLPRRLAAWAAAFATAIVLTACGGGGGGGEGGGEAPAPGTTPGTTPGTITPLDTRKVSTGDSHTCALQTAGTVRCWGANNSGQVGSGTTTLAVTTPVAVPDLSQVVSLSAGLEHSCALQAAGTVRCWGSNSVGQLGNGTSIDSSVTVAVTGLSDAKALASGSSHNCAIQASGSVVCWGLNSVGQLGNGTSTNSNIPVPVTGLTDAVALSLNGDFFGKSTTSCALRAVGTVVCWGSQLDGTVVLFNGEPDTVANITSKTTPVAVTGLADVRALAVGAFHACAIVGSGAVKCWGVNAFGGIGNGDGSLLTTVITPVAVTGITNAVALSANDGFSCALLADKTMRCWGLNFGGELGDGTDVNRSSPVKVKSLTDAVSVSSGTFHTCALRTGGALSCWGLNFSGQLGDGTEIDRSVPTPVQGGNIFFQ
jgi:alpha-tubulin suppressor-like RCC1 family protein